MNPFLKTIILAPAAYLYGAAMLIRNKLYDLNILKSTDTEITSISIGNITVGGTGKTPHSEYIIELLKDKYHTAYLSRGYKRLTSGFRMADQNDTAATIGDEACQIHRKYSDVIVAVDANRRNGIKQIKRSRSDTQVVILDDAYQHRTIHPDLSILLIDYNRLTYLDKMLPYGRLRESAQNTDRADIIIITKCPESIMPVDMLSIRVQINPFPYQNLYFTGITYKPIRPVFDAPERDFSGCDLLIVTGISQPQHLHAHLKNHNPTAIKTLIYPDHHRFTVGDIKDIQAELNKMNPTNRAVIVTEKDRARLMSMDIPDLLKQHLYYIGIEIDFKFGMQEKFDKEILKFAETRIQ